MQLVDCCLNAYMAFLRFDALHVQLGKVIGFGFRVLHMLVSMAIWLCVLPVANRLVEFFCNVRQQFYGKP